MKIKRTNQGKNFGLRWQPAEAKRSEDWSEAATPLFACFRHVQKRRGASLPAALQSAFTLIEMILAIGVAAIVLVAINAVFFSALHLREVTQAAVDEATPVNQALTILHRDLQCAVPPSPNGVLTGDFKAGTVTSIGISLPVATEMFTTTGALNENQPWGDIQRVTYELKDPADHTKPGKDLIRTVTRNLLSTAALDIEDQWLMSGIESIKFSCFDGAQWFDAWDTTDTTSVNTNLPVAVRVLIQMAGNNNGNARPQPIELLVPMDSQSRTNT